MRKDIQEDIKKIISLINSMERKSIFVCVNLEDYNIINFQGFSNLEDKDKKKDWIWFRIVKKENNKLYNSEIIIENKDNSSNKKKEIKILQNYIKFVLKCI